MAYRLTLAPWLKGYRPGDAAADGLAALIGSRGRHLSWPVFLAIAALAWWATRP